MYEGVTIWQLDCMDGVDMAEVVGADGVGGAVRVVFVLVHGLVKYDTRSSAGVIEVNNSTSVMIRPQLLFLLFRLLLWLRGSLSWVAGSSTSPFGMRSWQQVAFMPSRIVASMMQR